MPFDIASFFTYRSCFLQFSPEALVFLANKSLILFRPYLLRFSFVLSILYVHVIVSTSRLVFCCILSQFDMIGVLFLNYLYCMLVCPCVERSERSVRGVRCR
jgi:hypothetical protein